MGLWVDTREKSLGELVECKVYTLRQVGLKGVKTWGSYGGPG